MTISAYSATAGSNSTINGVNIAEGCPPGNINNAIRELMADIATFGPVSDAGDTMTGNLSLGRSSTSQGIDVEVLNRGTNADTTTAYRIGGFYGAAYRDITDPAYVCAVTFERVSASGGAASAGEIVFRTDSSGTASKTSIGERMRISQTTGITMALPVGITGSLDVTGNITASGTITPSDSRLKTDIEPITDGLAAVEAMQGVFYTRISDGSAQIGMIAQDLEAVRPQYVVTRPDGMKAISYQTIVADLVEAVKTLTAACRAHGVAV